LYWEHFFYDNESHNNGLMLNSVSIITGQKYSSNNYGKHAWCQTKEDDDFAMCKNYTTDYHPSAK